MRLSGSAIPLALVASVLTGWLGCRFERLSPPEIVEQEDPSGMINHPQEASARILLNDWEEVDVYIRYSMIPGELPLHGRQGEPNCRREAQRPNEFVCTYTFPGGHSLQVGHEMFYQWFADYRRPQATDASTVDGGRRSFIIRPGVSSDAGSGFPPRGRSTVIVQRSCLSKGSAHEPSRV